MPNKTFYLWDLADTLFAEQWDQKKSGLKNFNAYVKSRGYNIKTVPAINYEHCYKIPFLTGLLKVRPNRGFWEILQWTKNNGVFTTGNIEQLEWRWRQQKERGGRDFRKPLKEVHSTFDYGNTNRKNAKMFADILKKKHRQGFNTIVYADNKTSNCRYFISAVSKLRQQGLYIDYRLYHMSPGLKKFRKLRKRQYAVGGLQQILQIEKLA